MGLGSGQFNQIIWRYCLILKKWYYQATLPVPRRHMVTVFLKEKLVIVGGVGRHRLKLYTVDTLDIYTGTVSFHRNEKYLWLFRLSNSTFDCFR